MKKIRFIFFLIAFILLFNITIFAKETESIINDTIKDELSSFKDSLPSYVLDFLPEGLLEGDFSLLMSEELSEKRFFEYIIDYLFAGLGTVIKSFSSILVLILISSIFEMLSSHFQNGSLKVAFSACSTLTVSLSVFNACVSICQHTTVYINALCQAMHAFAPIMATIQIMTGNISSATVSNAAMVLFISVTEGFLVAFMLPLVKICMMLACVRSVGGLELSGITKVVKNTFTSVTIFSMSVFMFIFSIKNVLTQGADTLSIKTARFAISSFVPMVGASINEALRTLSSSLGFIKNACGVIAIIIVALIMLPILIYIFLNKVAFSLLASISKTIHLDNQCMVLDEADSLCTYMLTLVACTCTLFIFALTIFIKTQSVVNI